MSSLAVRTAVKQFLADGSDEDVIDLTGQFENLVDVVKDADLQPDAPWLGLEFIGGEELPVGLAATNDQGLYRETGAIHLHVVALGRLAVGDELVSRGETLRNLFRGARMDGIVIESVSPLNTGPGATLEFEAGYVSGSIEVAYYFDLNL